MLQLAQGGVEVADRMRVEAIGRFVEEQHAWRAQQGLGKAQSLPHPLGVLAHRAPAGMSKADALQQERALRQRRALEAGKEVQGFSPSRLS